MRRGFGFAILVLLVGCAACAPAAGRGTPRAVAPPAAAPPAGAIDWARVQQQATAFLQDYVRIDTSNPPGNEVAAARFLAGRLQQAGIDAQVFEAAPGRGSVLARVRGSGGGRPLILLHHLDVVPAAPAGWNVPPFAGVVRDGYVYGRGALDCKGPGTVDVMALLLLKQRGIVLKRDVILLGTADEEAGGALGAGWMVAHHFDELAGAAFLLTEGGDISVLPGGRRVYEVAVAEKTPCWLRLSAAGRTGHGAVPPPQTAVTRLVRAVARLEQRQPEVHVTSEVQAYFRALAPLQPPARRRRYQDLRAGLRDPNFRTAFLQNPEDAALVENTLTPTMLTAGDKINVIPAAATAQLDCRLLPGEDAAAFVAAVRRRIDDPQVRVDVVLNFPPASSPTNTALFAALTRLAAADHAAVVPSVLAGFTDSHYFREKGIASYGFNPFELTAEEAGREHGVNERLSVDNLREGTRRLVELLQTLDGMADDGSSGTRP